MVKKVSKIILYMALVFSLVIPLNVVASTNTVMWGKTELKLGQIGKVTVLRDTPVVKLDTNGNMSVVKRADKGEEFRVYSYQSKFGGLYGLGGGLFVQKNEAGLKYETPSKSKLSLLKGHSGSLPVVEKPTKPVSTSDMLLEELGKLESVNANEISQKDYFKQVDSFAKKIEDNKSKLNKNEKLIIPAKATGLLGKGGIKLTAIIYEHSDGVKVGETNLQDAYSITMFENKIYLNTYRIEQLVSVADNRIEFRGNKLPGGLEEVFYMGSYFNRKTEYYDMNDLHSKQYTSFSITNKINKTLEYSNKDYPYISGLTSGSFAINPYSIEEIRDILGMDFTYEYNSQNGVLTFKMPFESNKSK